MADPQQRDRNPQRDFGARLSSFERAGFVITGPEYPFKGAQVLSRIVEQGGGGGLLFVQVGGVLRLATVADLPAHALLGAQHSDALVGAVLRGDLIVGNATPAWARLALGAAGKYVGSDGTDALYRDLLESLIVRDSAVYGKLAAADTVSAAWSFAYGPAISMPNSGGDEGAILFSGGETQSDDVYAVIRDAVGDYALRLRGPGISLTGDRDQRWQDRSGMSMLRTDTVDVTGQTASIATTAWSTAPGAGMYQVNFVLESTGAAAAGTVSLTIGYTDDAGATTKTTTAIPLTGAGRLDAPPLQLYVASGNITYATTVTGLIGVPAYTVRLRLVPLG